MSRLPPISRRSFLAQSTALTAASTLPLGALAQETMITRAIPGTNEYLPVIGMGAPDFFYEATEEGSEIPKSLIQTMYDMGGRLVDTPAFFRPDPPVLAGYMQEMGLHDELFMIGKITVDGKEAARQHLERTSASLDKRPMDVMLVHNFRDMENSWPVLKEAKAEGKVRYIGVSRTNDVSNEELELFMRTENPDFLMPGYNMVQNQHEERILPLAQDMGTAVVVVEPFRVVDDGAYFSVTAGIDLPEWAAEFDCATWAQYALKYIVSNPAITCVVTETSKASHVADNMRGGYGRLPDEAMRRRMSEHFLSLV